MSWPSRVLLQQPLPPPLHKEGITPPEKPATVLRTKRKPSNNLHRQRERLSIHRSLPRMYMGKVINPPDCEKTNQIPNVRCSTGGSFLVYAKPKTEWLALGPSNYRASLQLASRCPLRNVRAPPPHTHHLYSPAFVVVSGVFSCPSLPKNEKTGTHLPPLALPSTGINIARHGDAAVGSEHSSAGARSLVRAHGTIYSTVHVTSWMRNYGRTRRNS